MKTSRPRSSRRGSARWPTARSWRRTPATSSRSPTSEAEAILTARAVARRTRTRSSSARSAPRPTRRPSTATSRPSTPSRSTRSTAPRTSSTAPPTTPSWSARSAAARRCGPGSGSPSTRWPGSPRRAPASTATASASPASPSPDGVAAARRHLDLAAARALARARCPRWSGSWVCCGVDYPRLDGGRDRLHPLRAQQPLGPRAGLAHGHRGRRRRSATRRQRLTAPTVRAPASSWPPTGARMRPCAARRRRLRPPLTPGRRSPSRLVRQPGQRCRQPWRPSQTCTGRSTRWSGRRSSSRASSSTPGVDAPTVTFAARVAAPLGRSPRQPAPGRSPRALQSRPDLVHRRAEATGRSTQRRRGRQRRHPAVAPQHLRPLVGRPGVDHQGHLAGAEGLAHPLDGG